MTPKDPLLTQSYDYVLDEHCIAKEPASPKDSAKLLVYDRATNTVTHAVFADIMNFLSSDVAILFNDTKVIKARLYGQKASGGAVELLINRPLPDDVFSVYIKGRVKKGSTLTFDEELQAQVVTAHEDGTRDVIFTQGGRVLDFDALQTVIERIGHLPLPPYMHREDTPEDETNYQTVFAHHAGAVAAPTASLHFTQELFSAVTTRHTHGFITLHVGAGTFKPVQSTTITDHPMHSEYFKLSPEAHAIINSDAKLLAVGTTVTRTVEYHMRTQETQGEANLFLHPFNKPMRVDCLLTNFHLPQSTLLMLVASFVGLEKTLELYEEAKAHSYRFYSYGDAMLIL